MVEQSHLQGEEQFVIEFLLKGVWVLHQLEGQNSVGWTFYQYFD